MSVLTDIEKIRADMHRRNRELHAAIVREVRQPDGKAYSDDVVDSAIGAAMATVSERGVNIVEATDDFYAQTNALARELVAGNGPTMTRLEDEMDEVLADRSARS